MREVDRLGVIREVAGKRLRQREAGERMGLSVRQVKRLPGAWGEFGARRRTMDSAGGRDPGVVPLLGLWAMAHVTEVLWGQTPSAEGLSRGSAGGCHHVPAVSARRRSTARRTGGSRTGGLCTLIVFIDDATSRLMALRLVEAETTEAYLRTLRGYLDQYGRPVAVYSDKHSIFRVNLMTQFPGAQDPRHPDLRRATKQDRLVRSCACAAYSMPTPSCPSSWPSPPQDAHRRHHPGSSATHGRPRYRLRSSPVTVCEARRS